ncbi:DnaJ family protein C protein 7 [Arthrobacter sp. PvP102]|jgi:DnaJ family protein C protein 7|uniref:J domain-containing protein n=1 Tax=unclassified Arthrobacter TaxID=235627 RepID=UPI0000526BCB|nr:MULTISPECIES: J domain-containing protein [unclassified Arthrobacter]ABK04822.1 heat shock protein DnaJ domain protein [Arthrobacter sp. FB24]MBP1232795.1 DnaJ family protein C protein 7 [Arthrobacter sp. PvP103]MBP1237930.1 DnaJ family protein C protein 7 [Arthrobacter sp. PvP102]
MINQSPDYYDVLNVARTATRQEISRAYRALMRLHHPDLEGRSSSAGPDTGGGPKNGGADNNGLLGIMEAFAVLSDAKTRAEYDRTLSVSRPGGGEPREVPVRRTYTPQPPLLRVTPVLWERGPWPGTG